MFEAIPEFFGNIASGFLGIISWVGAATCSLINSIAGIIGWLLVFVGLFFLLINQAFIGMLVFLVALGFLVIGEVFSLAAFWLSGTRYTISPKAFAGDLVGTAISFVILFGLLFGIWVIYPAQWLFIISLELVPIFILYSISRFTKNFIAMVKDKMSGKPKEKKK